MKKKRVWRGLLEYTKNIVRKSEEELDKLDNARFSENEVILEEERENLIQKYSRLIRELREEKETILRQMEKEVMPITPLRQKSLRLGHCYFCDIIIAAGFPYKLKEEEQNNLGIKVVEGAEFCSQECLLGYCKEYKNREKLRQEEGKRNREKIENDKKTVTEIQERMTKLIERENELERKERELELSPEDSIPREENVGFFRRIGQKLGLIKKNNPLSPLERVREKKTLLKIELERYKEKLQKALVVLSISEQVEQERQKTEKRLLDQQRKEKITMKKEEDE